jgi:hypothetical protein
MKLETKFNIGNKVFFLAQRKVAESKVKEIKIEVSDNRINIIYICTLQDDHIVGIKVNEEDAFKSKEILLKSL